MKQISRSFWPVSLLVLLIVAIFLVGFIFTGAVALLFGALLQSFLPFTLFEATILSTLFAAVTVYWFWRLVTTIAPPEIWQQPVREQRDEEEEEEQSYQTIAKSRFYQQEQERTWESWLHEELANDIYIEFQDAPDMVDTLSDPQTQEMAIRLADAAINILKRRTSRARRLAVTLADFQRELQRIGQRAYNDEMLNMVLLATNMNLHYYANILKNVIYNRRWNEPATLPDEKNGLGDASVNR
jgi:hypothetical protein